MITILGGAAVLMALGVAAAVVVPTRGWIQAVYGLTAAVCVVLAVAAGVALLGGAAAPTLVLPLGLPWVGAHFRLDALSALFVGVVDVGAALAALFAVGYGVHAKAPRRVLPFFPVFVAAMNLVVIADDAFTFLVSWELMSLASWALVVSNARDRGAARAGLLYIVMAGFGTLMLLLAFGLLAGADGGYAFASMRARPLPMWTGAAVLGLALLGAGSKAGLFPLHVWLPLAHPAAPSHVSALMSGIMTKVAIYGAIRIVFDLAGSALAWWWSVPVLVIGATTAVLGVLYALMQHDLKRLLAYHTVENIGIIFIGLGLALAFHANGLAASAAVALTAALLHVVNHSLFKSLLFLGAGAVLHATGERDIDRLGGLIRRMPATAALFLIGAAAISALPPLNGFVSEWLTFQSILVSPDLAQALLKFLVPTVGAALALSAALAAACFVKAFGVTFLGRPRSSAAAEARETDRWSLAAMAAIAVLCLAIGVLPTVAVGALAAVPAALVGAALPAVSAPPLSLVPFSAAQSSYNGFAILAFLLISGFASAWFIHRFAARGEHRGAAWDCGFPEASPRSQYTAASFSQPLRRVFGTVVFGAREVVDMPAPGETRPARLTVTMIDPAWAFVVEPVTAFVRAATERLNFLQFLTVRRYLTLVFVALSTLLVVVAVWG